MPTITIVNREGVEHKIHAQNGTSLMQNIRDGGFDELLALCGGNCACATCHVYVDHTLDFLPAPQLEETELLVISAHHTPDSRLSCQIEVSDALEGLRVVLAPED